MKYIAFRHLLAAALVAAAPAAWAAPHIWTLSGVRFDDGATASGSFTYDDVTMQVASWIVRVDGGPSFLGFTYVPGNSTVDFAEVMGEQPRIMFNSVDGGMPYIYEGSSYIAQRQFRITPVTRLDGSVSTVALNLATSGGQSGGVECFNCGPARIVTAGSLTLASLLPPMAVVQVDEFYNAKLDHYFITASESEKADLDGGKHPGWARTGQSFKAYATGSSAGGSINPVCRYYGNPAAGLDSHFYSASARECRDVHERFSTAWTFESDNVLQIALPDPATGACAGNTVPVFRLLNNRADTNHRYTTSTALRDEMVARGYVLEGYGPGVIMCAVAS